MEDGHQLFSSVKGAGQAVMGLGRCGERQVPITEKALEAQGLAGKLGAERVGPLPVLQGRGPTAGLGERRKARKAVRKGWAQSGDAEAPAKFEDFVPGSQGHFL